jgi:hypothetical protein
VCRQPSARGYGTRHGTSSAPATIAARHTECACYNRSTLLRSVAPRPLSSHRYKMGNFISGKCPPRADIARNVQFLRGQWCRRPRRLRHGPRAPLFTRSGAGIALLRSMLWQTPRLSYGSNIFPATPSPGIESLGLRVPPSSRMNQTKSVSYPIPHCHTPVDRAFEYSGGHGFDAVRARGQPGGFPP